MGVLTKLFTRRYRMIKLKACSHKKKSLFRKILQEKNAGFRHFLFFPFCLLEFSFSGTPKASICCKGFTEVRENNVTDA